MNINCSPVGFLPNSDHALEQYRTTGRAWPLQWGWGVGVGCSRQEGGHDMKII